MKTSIVAPFGGLLILAGGLTLASYTFTNAQLLQEAKHKKVQKYILKAQDSLKKGDIRDAEKSIKRAIVIDPKNKEVLKKFKEIVLSNCPTKGLATKVEGKSNSNPNKEQNKKMATPDNESDDEMGCI